MVNGAGMNGGGMGLGYAPPGFQSLFAALGMPPQGPAPMGMGPTTPSYHTIADPVPPMADITPEKVAAMVTRQRTIMEPLRQRQEKDYACWRLEWEDPRWPDGPPEDYATYRTLDPQTFGKRIMDMLGAAAGTFRVPYAANTKERRKFGEAKERFFISCLREADSRLLLRMEPLLQDSLASYITLRGWYAGRALLYKAQDGSTRVDISPFDPMHTFWERTEDGLKWVCHVRYRFPSEIRQAYPNPNPDMAVDEPSGDSKHEVAVPTYDFYDSQVNGLCTDKEWLKPLQPHGADQVPCVVGAVGSVPYIDRLNTSTGLADVEAWGTSVFTYVREAWSVENQTMSDRLTMVSRSLNRPMFVYGAGKATVEKDPWRRGSIVYLPDGAKVEVVNLQEMSKETDILLQQLSGATQRHTLSHTSYGQLGQPLSGYAINLLSMGTEFVVRHGIQALQNAYTQFARLLCVQYVTGSYTPIEAEGYAGKKYFQSVVMPGDVAQADSLNITFQARMAKDNASSYQLAQIARQGAEKGQQLLSKRFVLDEHLQIQDVDAELAIQNEEKAETMSPLAMLMGFITDAAERGRGDLVMVYTQELQTLMQQRAMQAAQAQQALAMGGMPGSAPGPRQFNPGGGLRPPQNPIAPAPTPEAKVLGPQEQARPPGQ